MVNKFENIWQNIPSTIDGEDISSELPVLARNVYIQLLNETTNLSKVKESLKELFAYLTTHGRTSANCRATDLFFSLMDWNTDQKVFPKELQIIIDDISHTLHDTFTHPEIAENFNGSPEQILQSIQNWEIK